MIIGRASCAFALAAVVVVVIIALVLAALGVISAAIIVGAGIVLTLGIMSLYDKLLRKEETRPGGTGSRRSA